MDIHLQYFKITLQNYILLLHHILLQIIRDIL